MQDDSRKRHNLITKERLLKGDMEVSRDSAGYINQAHVTDNSILAYLIARNILDDYHLSAAATYSLWQQAFRKPFFAEPRKLYLIELLGSPGGSANDESAYRKLLRTLNRLDHHNVEQAITQNVTEANRHWVYSLRHQYLRAFDTLIQSIIRIEKELEEIAADSKKPLARPCEPR